MEILLPRNSVISSWFFSNTSSPLKLISPLTIFPGGLAIRRMTESAVTLLPLPLSPTIPKVSPGLIIKETSSTAFTIPDRVKKYVFRLFTSSRFSAIFLSLHSLIFGSGVKGIAQAVAEEGEGQHNDGQHPRRQQDLPGMGIDQTLGLRDHQPDTRARRLHAQSQQADARLADNGAHDIQGGGHHHNAEEVGNDMAHDDARVAGARSASRLNELLLLELQGLPAHIARNQRPHRKRDGEGDQ